MLTNGNILASNDSKVKYEVIEYPYKRSNTGCPVTFFNLNAALKNGSKYSCTVSTLRFFAVFFPAFRPNHSCGTA